MNRSLREEQFLAHIRGRLQDELIVSAPEHWTSEVLEAVEEFQIRKSTKRISSLPGGQQSAAQVQRWGNHADYGARE